MTPSKSSPNGNPISYVHLSATIRKDTSERLDEYCTAIHHGKPVRIPRSHVIEDAIRKKLGMVAIVRE
jgi:hypothetical protein